ncbi:MAG: UDP-N-acetylmuramoyl-L-alanine--D-glutamate ligase [Candidatus Buchananbacteria bacterium]|nr:UDP-N-acetylmuramoyl-L-alanine--D-glutamate ligase [Candidatus Buchananbacteria bacterium]
MPSAFKDKKITVMGLGLHGGGAAVVKWLANQGACLTVTDLKNKRQLQPSLDALKGLKINYVLGRHRELDFVGADLIIQNPGVPRESRYLKIARKKGILIENDASLFFKHCPAPIIAVTGTRGKSTTTSLIYELLKQTSKKVWLAGLPQKPMLEILDRVHPSDIVVLELSSWQLEILGSFKLSPHVSVVTNIYPDHLNRYGSMAAYIAAKKNIFLWQTSRDSTVLNFDNAETKKLGREVSARRFWFSKKVFKEENGVFVVGQKIYLRRFGKQTFLADVSDVNLVGEHNLENVLAALAVVTMFGVTNRGIKTVLKKFQNLPGRLQMVFRKGGVEYINDTTATTPDGTIAALRALRSKNLVGKRIVLIAGGAGKNIPTIKYRQLAKEIKNSCRAVVLFAGEGGEKIGRTLRAEKFQPVAYDVCTMSEAIGLANSFAKPGDTVALSPASASFGMFINEFDRGDQFVALVKKL